MEGFIRHPNVDCLICGTSVYRRASQLEKNHGRVFCSMQCYGKSLHKTHPCAICGKTLLAKFNKKTCSRECSNKLRIGMNYKLSRPRKDKVRDGRILKARLLEMYGPKCQRCDYNKVEILQVHHKDKNHQNNEIENLELICPNCHYEQHFLEKSWLRGII